MQKSGLIIVVLGLFIVSGLVVSIFENQITLEGINQENGIVSITEKITVSNDFDREKTPIGIFAIQVMDFRENTFSVKVLDPSDIEIISQQIDKDTIEEEFDVLDTGTYKLQIESSSDDEIYVAGAIGPLPDPYKKFIMSIISTALIMIGMTGLAVIGIYLIKNRKSSV
ncbi:hypothetical protein BD31_I1154 [Candidatus Nitrosopumilus salaria BD31]|uniref:Uncharacterized protein n=1 Tax=Candidatus Nitrosopumilus salarius BD31 TaxID=859350 RepID=I3D0N3_9ARCH|nr:hypothetical protein [Candidatus Nitrosopumilus salaria]EIJ65276.1 hypothetical protein BD31_I1154 [Candidatus Nitrosopumilus salaria BD31]